MKDAVLKSIKTNICGIFAFSILLFMVVLECFMPERTIGKATVAESDSAPEELPVITGEYQVSFPYEEESIYFGNGWHSQSDGENYRWIRKQSYFYASLSDQSTIRLSGYVPAGIGAKRVVLYLNGKKIAKVKLKGEQLITIEGSLDRYLIKDGVNTFKIEFDKERIPKEGDADQRAFSAMINLIEFE